MLGDEEVGAPQAPRAIEELVFVGFHSRVAALDRSTGELIWQWKSPKGGGFVAVLLDGDRLIASVQGYTYCLDPPTGRLLWSNPLKGLGLGVPCLASVNGTTQMFARLAEAQAEAARAAAAGGGAAGH